MHPTSAVVVLVCCKNRFGVNPGKCFSNVDCVSGLNGVRAPHCDADNIECSWKLKENSLMKFNHGVLKEVKKEVLLCFWNLGKFNSLVY